MKMLKGLKKKHRYFSSLIVIREKLRQEHMQCIPFIVERYWIKCQSVKEEIDCPSGD